MRVRKAAGRPHRSAADGFAWFGVKPQAAVVISFLVFTWVLVVGCSRSDAPTPGDLRLVSLSPSITEVLLELGLADQIVGVGDSDSLAPDGVPTLGRFVDLDIERLIEVNPTHVLSTTAKAGLPPTVHELAQEGRYKIAAMGYPSTVQASVKQISDIGRAVGMGQEGDALSQRVTQQLEAIEALCADQPKRSALMVFATDPVYVSGPGSVNDELLTIAGGVNAVANAKSSYPILDKEAIVGAGPDVVFFMLPDGLAFSENDLRLASFVGLPIPAVQRDQLVLLNDPAMLRPGPSMPATAAAMAKVLHPELAEAIDEVLRGTR